MKKRNVLIVANWKMNPQTLSKAEKLFSDIQKTASRLQNVQTVICPPIAFLGELLHLYSGQKILFGVQDVFWQDEGSYTGYIGSAMIKNMGAEYVILGHSERRKLGEDNETINKKVLSALTEKLKIVLCVGEKERDVHGEYLTFLREELQSAFENVPIQMLKNIVIAYEPIWTIGREADDAMDPQEVHEMVIFIRKTLAEIYDANTAQRVPVLYGGSVEPSNASVLLERGEINGFLIGHASLVPQDFNEILSIASKRN
ncbi:triose-phosphate isomerase [Patescibacteria group bacterium]|nr:triose-phosphate isomerase [Patescibacteria group bacterium]